MGLEKEEASLVPKASSRDVIADQNITVMLDYIEENKMLPTSSENLGLQNLLSHTPATPKQAHDLLNFRKIGQEEFQPHVNYHILRDPSVSAPECRKCLHTFASTKARKKKEKQLDQERKLHQICMKKNDGDVFKRRKCTSGMWITIYTTTSRPGGPRWASMQRQ